MTFLSHRLPPVNGSSAPAWRWRTLYDVTEIEQLNDDVMHAMKAFDHGDKDIFSVRLALEEGVINAIKHGHAGDLSKPVRVGYAVDAQEVLIQIEDQGKGFNPDDLPDPLAPENLERCCGRGVFLIRAYMSWVRYNERGNCVTLCRRRSG